MDGAGRQQTRFTVSFAERLTFHRRRADKLLAALANGPQTVYALSQTMFRKLNATERFLAISEVLAHLEWLEERGEVVSVREGEQVVWRGKR